MPKGLPISYIKKWGISKLAWRKFRAGALTKGVSTRTSSSKKKGSKGGKSMGKKKKRRVGNRKIPLAIAVPLVYPLFNNAKRTQSWTDFGADPLLWFDVFIKQNMQSYLGMGYEDNKFHADRLFETYLPVGIGLVVHAVLSRKVSPWMAKIPFIGRYVTV